MMKTFLPALVLSTLTLSASAFAELTVDVSPQRGGAWVQVQKDGVPQANVDVTVPSQKSHYTTDQNGRAFVYSHREAAHTLTINISEEGGQSFAVQRLIPSSR
ncbi:hypothetical protein KDD30_18435 (plasmid) [Photobacterium sp. GJ3]|uniref:hypothetical protein n=1 Tax=Photobacterium sp. GJ3 TaxID=2829502 RepID=UPI001B8ADEA4|nr:hypothetical protein [Photobacterium sp. GJ3]QUJ70121.1 hypothetical protein KDD30_18435 [Photobacterium sp. GJ3]